VKTKDYVHLTALDFSKAFDTVIYHSSVKTPADFLVPCSPQLHGQFDYYLSDTQHLTKVKTVSKCLSINNASIIQGSGLGSIEYVCTASDLHTLCPDNSLSKYADDIIPFCSIQ
jgi:hypothetical protein